MKLGFIGLGNLAQPLATKGAIVCERVALLAKECNVVFSIVSDDAAAKNICEGENGLLTNLLAGGIHVSMSTILPKTAEYLAALHQQHQQHYLAAPVFGRPEAAVARKLNYAVSGEEDIRLRIEPLLKDAGATGVWDFGDNITAANSVKLCGNFLIASALEAIGESILLANQSGVDAQRMWDMFFQTLFNAPLYHNYGNIILQQKFEPAAFTAKLGLKDLDLVLQQAESVNQSMPLAQLLKQHMQRLVESGRDQLDWSAVSLGAVKN